MKDDELVRSAVEAAGRADDSVRTLLAQSEVDLYAALAQRVELAATGSPAVTEFSMAFSRDLLLRDESAISVGKRIFRRWSRALHQFACIPDKQDQDMRDRLWSALTGTEGATAVIAGC